MEPNDQMERMYALLSKKTAVFLALAEEVAILVRRLRLAALGSLVVLSLTAPLPLFAAPRVDQSPVTVQGPAIGSTTVQAPVTVSGVKSTLATVQSPASAPVLLTTGVAPANAPIPLTTSVAPTNAPVPLTTSVAPASAVAPAAPAQVRPSGPSLTTPTQASGPSPAVAIVPLSVQSPSKGNSGAVVQAPALGAAGPATVQAPVSAQVSPAAAPKGPLAAQAPAAGKSTAAVPVASLPTELQSLISTAASPVATTSQAAPAGQSPAAVSSLATLPLLPITGRGGLLDQAARAEVGQTARHDADQTPRDQIGGMFAGLAMATLLAIAATAAERRRGTVGGSLQATRPTAMHRIRISNWSSPPSTANLPRAGMRS